LRPDARQVLQPDGMQRALREPGAIRRELPAPHGSQYALRVQVCLRRGVPEPYEPQDEIPDAPPAVGFQREFQDSLPLQSEIPISLRKCGFHSAMPKHGFRGLPPARALQGALPKHGAQGVSPEPDSQVVPPEPDSPVVVPEYESQAAPPEPSFRELYGLPGSWLAHPIQNASWVRGSQTVPLEYGFPEWCVIRKLLRAHAIPAALQGYGFRDGLPKRCAQGRAAWLQPRCADVRH
jgi:hypothetical protein